MKIHPSSVLWAKPTPSYAKLTADIRREIDNTDLRHVRPSQLRALSKLLARDGLISDAQKLEFEIGRKPYATDTDDSPFDFIDSMESGAAFAAEFQQYVPGSGCADYYKGMACLATWIQDTADLHRRYAPFSVWA